MRARFAVVFAFASVAACDHGTLDVGVESPTATDGGAGDLAPPERERCNGRDDDGDGKIDEGCPIRLTHDAADDLEPAVDGHRVAWLRRRTVDTGDVVVMELPGGAERVVASNASNISISGDRVAFFDRTPGTVNHYAIVDLASGERIEVPPPPDASYGGGHGMLRGDLLVFSHYAPEMATWTENTDLSAFWISTRQLARLSTQINQQHEPLHDGKTVIWVDDRNGHHPFGVSHLFELWSADLTSGFVETRRTVRTGGNSIGWPLAFDGGRAVYYEIVGYSATNDGWSTRFDGTCQLWLHELASGTRTALTDAVPVSTSPCIAQAWRPHAVALSGRRLVVEGAPGSLDSVLTLVDLVDGARRPITTYRDAHAMQPSLDGDRLVWQDDRTGDFELWFMDLSDAERGDLSPEGVTP